MPYIAFAVIIIKHEPYSKPQTANLHPLVWLFNNVVFLCKRFIVKLFTWRDVYNSAVFQKLVTYLCIIAFRSRISRPFCIIVLCPSFISSNTLIHPCRTFAIVHKANDFCIIADRFITLAASPIDLYAQYSTREC